MPSVLSSDALTTLTNLKEMVGVAEAVTTYDNKLERAINRATRWIEGETGRKLKARSYNGFNASGEGSDFDHKTTSSGDTVASEDYLFFSDRETYQDDCGRGVYHLPQFPVLKVVSTSRNIITHPNALTFRLQVLENRGSDVSGYETWTTLTEWDDYLLEHEDGVVRLIGTAFGAGVRNYRIKCTAGFSVGPANTQPYVPPELEELCIEVARKLYHNTQGVTSEAIGTWSRSYNSDEKEKWIKDTLALYTRNRLI